MPSLTERAAILQSQGIFIGGSARIFDIPGRKILMTLLASGLFPNSKVLDFGCGCLRGGYWLIHFLERDCYFGIEPDSEMLHAGATILMEPEEIERKNPRFNFNHDFDFTVFGQTFDLLLPVPSGHMPVKNRSALCWMVLPRQLLTEEFS